MLVRDLFNPFLRQVGTLQVVAKVLSRHIKLKPNLVVAKALAGQARSFNRIFAFFYLLLSGATLIVEMDGLVRLHRQISDGEAHAGEQIAGMPFDLGNHPASFAPGCRLLLEYIVKPANIVGWAAYGSLQQMHDRLLQDGVAFEAGGVPVAVCF
jgi:hypothetical protein